MDEDDAHLNNVRWLSSAGETSGSKANVRQKADRSSMPERKYTDINIGEDRWITARDRQGRLDKAIGLDGILEPIEPFLSALETECVAECCGIRAYDLWPDNVARAARQWQGADLSDLMALVRANIEEMSGDECLSHRMNIHLHKQTFLELLDHLADCIRNAGDIDTD
ncbi:MAG: DUF6331 family protein [Pirellulaceae bacterium]